MTSSPLKLSCRCGATLETMTGAESARQKVIEQFFEEHPCGHDEMSADWTAALRSDSRPASSSADSAGAESTESTLTSDAQGARSGNAGSLTPTSLPGVEGATTAPSQENDLLHPEPSDDDAASKNCWCSDGRVVAGCPVHSPPLGMTTRDLTADNAVTPDMREARRLIERLVECHDWLAPQAKAESDCKTIREAREFLSAVKAEAVGDGR